VRGQTNHENKKSSAWEQIKQIGCNIDNYNIINGLLTLPKDSITYLLKIDQFFFTMYLLF
jgi:hypothetical protein